MEHEHRIVILRYSGEAFESVFFSCRTNDVFLYGYDWFNSFYKVTQPCSPLQKNFFLWSCLFVRPSIIVFSRCQAVGPFPGTGRKSGVKEADENDLLEI